MKQLVHAFAKGGAIALFLAALLMPSATFAQTQTVNPFDENVQQLLESMDLDISPTDSIWNNREFNEFIESYLTLVDKGEEMIDLFAEIGLGFFDLVEKVDRVQDQRFAEFKLSDNDRAEIDRERQTIKDELEEFKSGEENFLDLFFSGFLGGFGDPFDDFDDYDEYEYDFESDFWVDSYTTTDYFTEAGNIVFMQSDAFGGEGDVMFTWEQTWGPEVQLFLNTEDDSTLAFITPEYDVLGDQMYIEFMITATDEAGNSYTSYAWVDLVMG